jgi:hypothetical protein
LKVIVSWPGSRVLTPTSSMLVSMVTGVVVVVVMRSVVVIVEYLAAARPATACESAGVPLSRSERTVVERCMVMNVKMLKMDAYELIV